MKMNSDVQNNQGKMRFPSANAIVRKMFVIYSIEQLSRSEVITIVDVSEEKM